MSIGIGIGMLLCIYLSLLTFSLHSIIFFNYPWLCVANSTLACSVRTQWAEAEFFICSNDLPVGKWYLNNVISHPINVFIKIKWHGHWVDYFISTHNLYSNVMASIIFAIPMNYSYEHWQCNDWANQFQPCCHAVVDHCDLSYCPFQRFRSKWLYRFI